MGIFIYGVGFERTQQQLNCKNSVILTTVNVRKETISDYTIPQRGMEDIREVVRKFSMCCM
jgi:hypothetical protein